MNPKRRHSDKVPIQALQRALPRPELNVYSFFQPPKNRCRLGAVSQHKHGTNSNASFPRRKASIREVGIEVHVNQSQFDDATLEQRKLRRIRNPNRVTDTGLDQVGLRPSFENVSCYDRRKPCTERPTHFSAKLSMPSRNMLRRFGTSQVINTHNSDSATLGPS